RATLPDLFSRCADGINEIILLVCPNVSLDRLRKRCIERTFITVRRASARLVRSCVIARSTPQLQARLIRQAADRSEAFYYSTLLEKIPQAYGLDQIGT